MSDLARTFAKTKLSTLPPEAPLPESGEEPEPRASDDGDSSSASSMSSTGTIVPSDSVPAKPPLPTSWTDSFSQELYLETQLPLQGRAKYHVYLTPPTTHNAPLIVCHHGAGSSGLSFSLFAKELRKVEPGYGVLSVEARDHGSAVYSPSGELDNDLSLDALSHDFVNMIELTKQKMCWSSLPSLILLGHSLGGAVVTHTATKTHFGGKLIGYAVIDVVEGSALEIVVQMRSYLMSRPKSFPTVEAAIEWHIRSRTIRNPTSARASVPSLLFQMPSGKWTWRTDLSRTEPFWNDWFTGMSDKFLVGKGAKLLLLAGTDRLDKPLMIGQMQGKFQMQVFPAAGHFVQEDMPEKTAELVVEFYKRNDRSALVLPPKVSDLIKQGKKV